VALIELSKITRRDIEDAAFVNLSWGDKPLPDKLSEPGCGIWVDLVVICCHRRVARADAYGLSSLES
jgi:hypothetical protein